MGKKGKETKVSGPGLKTKRVESADSSTIKSIDHLRLSVGKSIDYSSTEIILAKDTTMPVESIRFFSILIQSLKTWHDEIENWEKEYLELKEKMNKSTLRKWNELLPRLPVYFPGFEEILNQFLDVLKTASKYFHFNDPAGSGKSTALFKLFMIVKYFVPLTPLHFIYLTDGYVLVKSTVNEASDPAVTPSEFWNIDELVILPKRYDACNNKGLLDKYEYIFHDLACEKECPADTKCKCDFEIQKNRIKENHLGLATDYRQAARGEIIDLCKIENSDYLVAIDDIDQLKLLEDHKIFSYDNIDKLAKFIHELGIDTRSIVIETVYKIIDFINEKQEKTSHEKLFEMIKKMDADIIDIHKAIYKYILNVYEFIYAGFFEDKSLPRLELFQVIGEFMTKIKNYDIDIEIFKASLEFDEDDIDMVLSNDKLFVLLGLAKKVIFIGANRDYTLIEKAIGKKIKKTILGAIDPASMKYSYEVIQGIPSSGKGGFTKILENDVTTSEYVNACVDTIKKHPGERGYFPCRIKAAYKVMKLIEAKAGIKMYNAIGAAKLKEAENEKKKRIEAGDPNPDAFLGQYVMTSFEIAGSNLFSKFDFSVCVGAPFDNQNWIKRRSIIHQIDLAILNKAVIYNMYHAATRPRKKSFTAYILAKINLDIIWINYKKRHLSRITDESDDYELSEARSYLTRKAIAGKVTRLDHFPYHKIVDKLVREKIAIVEEIEMKKRRKGSCKTRYIIRLLRKSEKAHYKSIDTKKYEISEV